MCLRNENLPNYIRRNKYICTLLYDRINRRHKQNSLALCWFRAVVVFKKMQETKEIPESYERDARSLYDQYQDFMVNQGYQKKKIPVKRYPGMKLSELILAEKKFSVRCQVWELIPKNRKGHRRKIPIIPAIENLDTAVISEAETMEGDQCFDNDDLVGADDCVGNTKASVIRYPILDKAPGSSIDKDQPPIMHLVLHDSHFMIITSIDHFTKRYTTFVLVRAQRELMKINYFYSYQCFSCDRIFNQYKKLKSHLAAKKKKHSVDGDSDDAPCPHGQSKLNFTNGSAGSRVTLWHRLALQTDIRIKQSATFYEYR